MQEPHRPHGSVVELLDVLEAQVTRSSDLEREWQAAFADFPHRGDAGALLRFREWFLLERVAESLGAAPVQAWAPPDLEEDSTWFRLLDNVYGIFQTRGVGPAGGRMLEDLWSGQILEWVGCPEELPRDRELLVIGRFCLVAEGQHEALPGVFAAGAPGLVAAVERDLNAWRAENPRSRLSQRECEELFHPWFAPAEAPAARDEAVQAAEIDRLLAPESGWDRDRLLARLAAVGPAQLLDELAFDTAIDLDSARRLVHALVGAGDAAESAPSAPQPEEPMPVETPAGLDDPELALRRFDAARAKGMSVEDSFRQLEVDLGLEPGSSREREDEEPIGPPGPADLGELVAAYAWERQATGAPLADGEGEALEGFVAFAAALRDEQRQQALSAQAVVAWLMQAGHPERFEAARERLQPFLDWAAREQDEPVDALAQALGTGLGTLLQAAVAFNHERAAAGATTNSHARVVALDPVRVRAGEGDDAEQAEVDGLPAGPGPRVGDLLGGCWHAGRFEAAAWIPAEALPGGPPEDEAD